MNELLVQGVSVMCIGMGTVLSFLLITILSMFIMSNVVRKLNTIFPEAIPQVAGGKPKRLYLMMQKLLQLLLLLCLEKHN